MDVWLTSKCWLDVGGEPDRDAMQEFLNEIFTLAERQFFYKGLLITQKVVNEFWWILRDAWHASLAKNIRFWCWSRSLSEYRNFNGFFLPLWNSFHNFFRPISGGGLWSADKLVENQNIPASMPCSTVQVADGHLEKVDAFVYLGIAWSTPLVAAGVRLCVGLA